MNNASEIDFKMSSGAVDAEIHFMIATADRPYTYAYEPGDDAPPPTAAFTAHRVEIENARTKSIPLSIDKHGATLIEHPCRVEDLYDSEQIVAKYYPEAAAAIKAATGANRVVVFDHNVRRGHSLTLHPDRYRQGRPVLHAHTDFTETSVVRRLRDELGPEATELQANRLLQVNLWRPIRAPLRDFPLAICDASSIGTDQLVAVDLLYRDRRGEIYYLTYDPTQRWYYAPDMEVDEAWLFKNYDSAANVPARFAAHSAFNAPSRSVRVDARESIEVRAFAFFDA